MVFPVTANVGKGVTARVPVTAQPVYDPLLTSSVTVCVPALSVGVGLDSVEEKFVGPLTVHNHPETVPVGVAEKLTLAPSQASLKLPNDADSEGGLVALMLR